MQQPNGIGITPDNELIVAYCNETVWQWWKWQLDEDGSVAGEKTIFIDGKETMSGPGYPGNDHNFEGQIVTK
jgi:sugar lactone lactonase YvrE